MLYFVLRGGTVVSPGDKDALKNDNAVARTIKYTLKHNTAP